MSDREYPWLERSTAAVLLLVLAALGGMVLAAWHPEWTRGLAARHPEWASWVAPEVQVGVVLALLVAALLLVSATALLHTRS